MKLKLLVVGFALSTAAWGALVTPETGPNGAYIDFKIGDLGGVQVGAYDISVEYNPILITVSEVTSVGSLGIPGVETFWQSQSTAISPTIQRLQLIEVSLLSAADLLRLQPQTFGLVRLSLQSNGAGTAIFSLSGVISDTVGDPINTTFTTGQVPDNVPEPGTLSLLMVAFIPLLLRSGFVRRYPCAAARAKRAL